MNEQETKDFKESANKIFRAPARINLIGEHIDYNGGLVLPACVSLYLTAYVKYRDDDQYSIIIENTDCGIIMNIKNSMSTIPLHSNMRMFIYFCCLSMLIYIIVYIQSNTLLFEVAISIIYLPDNMC